MGGHGKETDRRAPCTPPHRLLNLCASGMFVQEFDLPHMATNAGAAVLLALALISPVACSTEYEESKGSVREGRLLGCAVRTPSSGRAGDIPMLRPTWATCTPMGRAFGRITLWLLSGIARPPTRATLGPNTTWDACTTTATACRRDYALAVQWLRKAADQGNDVAEVCTTTARACRRITLWPPSGFARPPTKATIHAQRNLGLSYREGDGVPQDYALAVQWLRKAADQGTADAQNNLGGMYYDGKGVPQDYALAAQWSRKAADQGNDHAQFNLSRMYYNGEGVHAGLRLRLRMGSREKPRCCARHGIGASKQKPSSISHDIGSNCRGPSSEPGVPSPNSTASGFGWGIADD